MKKSRKELMDIWKKMKTKIASNLPEIKKLIPKKVREEYTAKNRSLVGYAIIKRQLIDLQLDGEPYDDAKTFYMWKQSGFSVKKGEKSNLFGISWISVKSKNKDNKDLESDEESYIYPKSYSLFHRSQVINNEMSKKLNKLNAIGSV